MNKFKVGDIINGYPVLPVEQRKTILLLSDDVRLFSGISSAARSFVMNMLHHYKFVNLGGALSHPDQGKIIDMNQAMREETGIPDAQCKIYPISGYGDPNTLLNIIDIEKPDMILHFTDPRFWIWLYQMEHELRAKFNIPILYYTIWDCPPVPHWNKPFYQSCDLLMCISKQTHALVRGALGEGNFRTEETVKDNDKPLITYVPHGIDHNLFYPIEKTSTEYNAVEVLRNKTLNGKDKDFVLFYNSRNIRRKMTSDAILAFKTFCDTLPKEKSDKCVFVLKTNGQDENGTNLYAVIKAVCPDYDVVIVDQGISAKDLNILYNIADVTINIASNEGFGLGTAESLMAGTPIIVNVTGGLQDQCGFKFDGKYLTIENYTVKHPSNHNKTFTEHGEWVKPVFPANRCLMGSIPTPYIFDDRCKWEDASIAIGEWYKTSQEERERCGQLGREFVMREDIGMSAGQMGKNMIDSIELYLSNKSTRKMFELVDTDVVTEKLETGIIV